MSNLIYIFGDLMTVNVSIKPQTTGSWLIWLWGGGGAPNTDGSAGWAAPWASLNAYSAVAGTPITAYLGAPGQAFGAAGDDAWWVSTALCYSPGGGHFVAGVGDATASGGTPGTSTSGGRSGGAGAGGPLGVGGNGASQSTTNTPGGGGGGANGGSAGGAASSTVGGLGGGVGGGLGGTSTTLVGAPGLIGAGGGGGFAGANGFGGGVGGDNPDGGGGGGGGGGHASPWAMGGNGGTPGGGAGGSDIATVTSAIGGRSLIRIQYTGADPIITLTGGGFIRRPTWARAPVSF